MRLSDALSMTGILAAGVTARLIGAGGCAAAGSLDAILHKHLPVGFWPLADLGFAAHETTRRRFLGHYDADDQRRLYADFDRVASQGLAPPQTPALTPLPAHSAHNNKLRSSTGHQLCTR
jgi:hypothetical protein